MKPTMLTAELIGEYPHRLTALSILASLFVLQDRHIFLLRFFKVAKLLGKVAIYVGLATLTQVPWLTCVECCR